MRLVGWGVLCGFVAFMLPYTATTAVGLAHEPAAFGYVLFSAPVVAGAGVLVGAFGGLLAAGIAPLARRGRSTAVAQVLCTALHLVAVTGVLIGVLVLVVDVQARPGAAPAVVLAVLVATALAACAFTLERRRARVPTPPTADLGRRSR
ncbi:MAG TPA: hypothetical protein VGC04_05935 [Cellulomonas sp.]